MLLSTVPTLLAIALGVYGNTAHAATPEIAHPILTLTCGCTAPADIAVEPDMAMDPVGPQTDIAPSMEELTEVWAEFVEWLGGIFTPAHHQVAGLTPEQLALLDSAMTREEANVWYESQPQDHLGIPVLSEQEVQDMTRKVEMLAAMLEGDRLSPAERERVESTLLVKVALIEANRFGSDVREDLLVLLETRRPDGQAIDQEEADMLVSVAKGKQLLFEALPILPLGLAG